MRSKLSSDLRPTVEQIYRDDLGFVFRTLERFGVLGVDIEDVAQDVLLSLEDTLANYEPTLSRFRTWLYKVVYFHACAYHHRAYRWREILMEDHGLEPQHASLRALCEARHEPLPSVYDAPSADQILSLMDRCGLVADVLATLRPIHRAVLLAEMDDMSMDEFAKREGLPLSTVWSRRSAAREHVVIALRRKRIRTIDDLP